MNEKRRMAGLLVVCLACAFILGCTSTPSITPEVIDVQTGLTDATDTLGDAIQDSADSAQEIADVTAGTEYAELTAQHAKEVRKLVALHKTLEEKVTAANELSLKLAGQSEELRTENLEQKTEIAILKRQRLALILILGFLFTLFLLYLYARIKNLSKNPRRAKTVSRIRPPPSYRGFFFANICLTCDGLARSQVEAVVRC